MKRIKKIYIALAVGAVLMIGFYTSMPSTVFPFVGLINKNTIDILVEVPLQREKIYIGWSVPGIVDEEMTICHGASTQAIPNEYGENDWTLTYDGWYATFRHFKTNNWHNHDYTFSFYKEGDNLFCKIDIDGPDRINDQLVALNKKIMD